MFMMSDVMQTRGRARDEHVQGCYEQGVMMKVSVARRWVVAAVSAALAVATVSGCSGESQDDPTGPAVSPSSSTADVEALADGEYFGFVTDVSDDALGIRLAEFFDGDDARAAAAADGLDPDDALPNGFYMRDDDGQVYHVALAEDLSASLYDTTTDPIATRELDRQELIALFTGDADATWVYGSLEDLPAHLTIQGAEVTGLTEQYLP